ncbi:MAG: hypothetical protein GY925_19655, partial [Actinomycetia bacterium]|nr:hypothetical protein [Actinomycetes bacterium]
LEAVEVLADSSPVLIFQNEKAKRSKQIGIGGIRGRFPNVVGDLYRGDLIERSAADDIRDAIEFHATKLDHVGDKVPLKWIDIRNDLAELARSEWVIDEATYFEIYTRHLPFDEVKARRLSEYLHDLGVFLHFQQHDLLRRILILRNEWATEAVFAVVNDEDIKTRWGQFDRSDGERIWAQPRYDGRHPELRALLEQFEFCYQLPTTEPQWLAPQLLPPERPPNLDSWAEPGDLSLVYHYDFLPRGIISRLIVREDRYVTDLAQAWRTGVLLTRGDTELLVEVTTRNDDIVLRSRGPERKELLSAVAADL